MSKRVVFYYVRHGETQFNRDGVIQGGRVDSALTDETLPVLDRTREALRDIPLAAVCMAFYVVENILRQIKDLQTL